MTFIFQILHVLIIAYIFIISMRILLGWFPGAQYNKLYEIMVRMATPYLDLFKGIRFLRQGPFDFTPFVGIMVLYFFAELFRYLAFYQMITIGIVLLIIVMIIISAVNLFLLVFLIIAGIRFFSLYSHSKSRGLLWDNIDLILQPVIRIVLRFFSTKLPYRNLLLIACISLGAVLIASHFLLVPFIQALFLNIPF
ncbi:MAG: YggT family protein [Spirochaetales bacterium]|nr:YggT family protein [Spirochaetales bacterium]